MEDVDRADIPVSTDKQQRSDGFDVNHDAVKSNAPRPNLDGCQEFGL